MIASIFRLYSWSTLSFSVSKRDQQSFVAAFGLGSANSWVQFYFTHVRLWMRVTVSLKPREAHFYVKDGVKMVRGKFGGREVDGEYAGFSGNRVYRDRPDADAKRVLVDVEWPDNVPFRSIG